MSSVLGPTKELKEELRGVIGWLRPDPRRRLTPAWALGVALVLVGASVCAVFFWGYQRGDTPAAREGEPLLLIAGLLAVLSGMLTMVVSAFQVLRDERSLTFLESGLSYHDVRGKEYRLTWGDIDTIEMIERGLRIQRIDGPSITIRLDWIAADPAELRHALLEIRRRSLMGVPQDIAATITELNLKLTISSQRRRSIS